MNDQALNYILMYYFLVYVKQFPLTHDWSHECAWRVYQGHQQLL